VLAAQEFHFVQNCLALRTVKTDNPETNSTHAKFPSGLTPLRAFAPALALLAIAVLINYVDRGNLSIAALLV